MLLRTPFSLVEHVRQLGPQIEQLLQNLTVSALDDFALLLDLLSESEGSLRTLLNLCLSLLHGPIHDVLSPLQAETQ